MPILTVVEAIAASIQGLGYYGAQRYGIAPGGAMDRMALAEANALTGQPAGAAAIEIGPLPVRFAIAGGPVRLCLAGAARDVLIGNRVLPMGVTTLVRDGETVIVRGARGGQYSYLSVEGGLRPNAAGAGGVEARPRRMIHASDPRSWILQPGDVIALAAASPAPAERRLRLTAYSSAPIRVVLGPQLDYFSAEAVARFLATDWIVSHASNRMAYVLEGGRVALAKGHNIVSDGTVNGNIQIAGSGQPLVILSDRGTVGGYPKVATVISADLGRFAQTPQGGRITFEAVSVLEAQVVARDFAERLASVKPRVEALAVPPPSSDLLLASNLAGDAVNALDWVAGFAAEADTIMGSAP